jgi:hypothetical protein
LLLQKLETNTVLKCFVSDMSTIFC